MSRPVALLLLGLGLATFLSFCGMNFLMTADPPLQRAVIDQPPRVTSPPPAPVPPATSGQSDNCGPINGKTPIDLQHLQTFCSKGLTPGNVVAAIAMDSLLWLKVSREFADAIRMDRLSAEQIIKTWMQIWRSLVGRASVTVFVEWQDVEIAKGDTTVFSGDQVTIR